MQKSKLSQIRSAWAAGDQIGALRIAARFVDRSPETVAFKRGMDAHNNPGFYRQLGKNPEALTRAALEALLAESRPGQTIVLTVALTLAAAPAMASELPMSADVARTMGALIRANGYNCPAAKLAFAKGEDAYGTVIKIHCGPVGQSGVYKNAVFRVTARPDGRMMVRGWE